MHLTSWKTRNLKKPIQKRNKSSARIFFIMIVLELQLQAANRIGIP